MSADRVVVMRVTPGVSRYIVFMPELFGAHDIGFVTKVTTGGWQAVDHTLSRVGSTFDRRRDAVTALSEYAVRRRNNMIEYDRKRARA